MRPVLIEHWTSSDHPYRRRFLAGRELIEKVLSGLPERDDELDRELRSMGTCLEEIAKDIPSIYGDALAVYVHERGKLSPC